MSEVADAGARQRVGADGGRAVRGRRAGTRRARWRRAFPERWPPGPRRSSPDDHRRRHPPRLDRRVGILLAAFVIWRWRRLGFEKQDPRSARRRRADRLRHAASIHPPSLDEILLDIGKALGPYTYILVGVMAFLETGAFVGLIAPGETVVIVGGLVAGQGEINIVILIGLVWFCAVAGDTTSFLLGRRLGREFLLKPRPRVRITEARLEQVEGFLHRHGGSTILFGRFLGLVRALAPFVAGASRMPLRRFLPYDVVARRGVGDDVLPPGLHLLAVVRHRRQHRQEERAGGRHDGRRWSSARSSPTAICGCRRTARRPSAGSTSRPIARCCAPSPASPARLPAGGAARVAPARALPALPVGARHSRPARPRADDAPGDRLRRRLPLLRPRLDGRRGRSSSQTDTTAFDIAGRIETSWLDDVLKVVTTSAALPVVGAGGLRRRGLPARAPSHRRGRRARRRNGPHRDRRRTSPSRSSTVRGRPIPWSGTDGLELPVRPRRVRGGLCGDRDGRGPTRSRASCTARRSSPRRSCSPRSIGLSRVYLRAHYLTDVLGGWGMAAALFSVCGSWRWSSPPFAHNGQADV